MPNSSNRAAAAHAASREVSDGTLRSFAGYSMKRAFNVIQADLAETLAPFGLRMMSFTALILVVDNPGLRQTQLADALAMERSNLVTIVDQLEERGWIARKPVPSDRRSHALQATAEGVAVCRKAVAAAKAHEARLLAGLDAAETEKLKAALMTVEKGKSA